MKKPTPRKTALLGSCAMAFAGGILAAGPAHAAALPPHITCSYGDVAKYDNDGLTIHGFDCTGGEPDPGSAARVTLISDDATFDCERAQFTPGFGALFASHCTPAQVSISCQDGYPGLRSLVAFGCTGLPARLGGPAKITLTSGPSTGTYECRVVVAADPDRGVIAAEDCDRAR